MRISDWSSDVCSSDLFDQGLHALVAAGCLDIELFDGVRCITKAGDHRMKASHDLMRRHAFPCRVGWLLTLPATDGLGMSFWVPRFWRPALPRPRVDARSFPFTPPACPPPRPSSGSFLSC